MLQILIVSALIASVNCELQQQNKKDTRREEQEVTRKADAHAEGH